ncbi:alpha/beta hydrolase [Brevibacterium sp. JSBI002]|uniref:alpha/beta hydrolase n=1 Tax=Brevibacterium sp. JSBI002 TaxID=2886045 RepID=UPI00222E657D|nr:alpha/beta hydrolase [Brevibacterium sp. JSBI002]UZD61760.1 alpha/beta hydrolase [Brevibacterium sp. JSBI002]
MSVESVRIPELSAAGAAMVPSFRHVYGDSPEQFVEVFGDPAAASATVVFVHGGYFRPRTDLAHARPLARALAEAEVLVASVEYRRLGGQPLLLDDVTAGIDSVCAELPSWGVSEHARQNLIVSGHSAGGCLVLAWASHLPAEGPRIRLRPLAPVTDLLREVEGNLGDGAVLDYMGVRPEDDLEVYLRHDPRSRAALIPPRVDMHSIHGDADATVDVEFSRVFPAALTELPGANHADVIDPDSPFFPQVRNLLLG